MRAAPALRRRDCAHRAVGDRIDLEHVAVLEARAALDHLLAGDPRLPRRLAAGAVRRGAAEDRERLADERRRPAEDRPRVDDDLGVAAERRGVVLERRTRDDLLLARLLAVLVVADEDRRAALLGREGAHPVEDAGHGLSVAHRLALLLHGHELERRGQQERVAARVGLGHQWPVADGALALLRHGVGGECAQRARRREGARRDAGAPEEGPPVDRLHQFPPAAACDRRRWHGADAGSGAVRRCDGPVTGNKAITPHRRGAPGSRRRVDGYTARPACRR